VGVLLEYVLETLLYKRHCLEQSTVVGTLTEKKMIWLAGYQDNGREEEEKRRCQRRRAKNRILRLLPHDEAMVVRKLSSRSEDEEWSQQASASERGAEKWWQRPLPPSTAENKPAYRLEKTRAYAL
jgi:hypothetical protein